MAHRTESVRNIVDCAVEHQWSIPEFQRGFVWKPSQVKDLIESCWLGYPVGSFLVWNSRKPTEQRHAHDARSPSLWVVDGQQRTTAFSVLMGRKPYWWPSKEEWDETLKRYDVRFDVETLEGPFFVVANAPIRRSKSLRYLRVSDLLNLDTSKDDQQQKLRDLAKAVKDEGLCQGRDAMEVYTRLDRVRKIRDMDVIVITVDHDLEDVVEIFARLNSRGTRVTEADIYLGIVAARSPGFVRDDFLPFLKVLERAGFMLNPNLMFRCLTGLGAKNVRFGEVPDNFWNGDSIRNHWNGTKSAWKNLIAGFRDRGVLGSDPLPSAAGLITLISLIDKHPNADFGPVLYWFLQATRYGRYSGSGTSSLNEDLREVRDTESIQETLRKLLARIPGVAPLTKDDFLRDYGDALFMRFLLYLMVYRNEAKNWDEAGHRIGFDGLEVLSDFRPQWHHVFPRGYLEDKVSPAELIDAVANIAVIGPSINIRISDTSPMDYIHKYKITDEKLEAQYIGMDIVDIGTDGYLGWLDKRAERLAKEGNEFLDRLKGEL